MTRLQFLQNVLTLASICSSDYSLLGSCNVSVSVFSCMFGKHTLMILSLSLECDVPVHLLSDYSLSSEL